MRTLRRLMLAAAMALLSISATRAAEPTLRRVLLSTGGVGYFDFEAVPDAQGHVRLTVPLAQVDDVLKSLTVLGGDGAVRGVSLLGPTPLADLFRDAPFGEHDLIDLPTLLLRLRGAEIEVAGPAKVRGRILAVAREEVVEGDRATVRHRLSLAAPNGIRSVILESVDGLTFTDAALQARIGVVLARLADDGAEQTRELELALGADPAPITLGYLAETPLWKASWRIVAGETDGLLQGWAILENASGQDWHDVAVTLIGGSPRALRQSLFARRFVDRPEVAPEGSMAKAASRTDAPLAAAPPEADMMTSLRRAPAELETAPAQELTAQTLFPLPQPLTLATGHTAMAPIVDRRVFIERMALYRASESGKHPSAALRLRNDTGASLPPGLVTLYEVLPAGGMTYLGDAPLPQTAAGREQTLAYGLDGTVDVTVDSETRARIDRAKVVDGVLELTRVDQQHFDYKVDLAADAALRSFVLEQPRGPDWRVAAPADAVIDGGTARITRQLEPGKPLEIAVILEQPQVTRVSLLDLDLDALRLEFAGAEPPPSCGRSWHVSRNSPARSARCNGTSTPRRSTGTRPRAIRIGSATTLQQCRRAATLPAATSPHCPRARTASSRSRRT
jgi:hypothetical protein